MSNTFGIIYKATNIHNNKCYIGQTTNSLKGRIGEHFSKAKKSIKKTYFVKALLKYGKAGFTWQVLENCDSKEELDEMEYHYIRQFNTFGSGGYNLTYGGEGCIGYKHSEANLEKCRQQRLGCKLSKEEIEHRSYEQSYDWELTYPNGDVAVIRNLSKFCRDNNLAAGCMRRVSRGRRQSYRGYKCRLLSDNSTRHMSEENKKIVSSRSKGRRATKETIEKIIDNNSAHWELKTPEGNVIEVYNLKDYCNQNSISYNSMVRVGRGERTHHKGYKVKKLNI